MKWLKGAKSLSGTEFEEFQVELARYNAVRLDPTLPEDAATSQFETDYRVGVAEIEFIEAHRAVVAPLMKDVPTEVDAFMRWYEHLKVTGPGQGDPLFPWLATSATGEEMKWFLLQEVAGEAGFDDLLAMTQIKMPIDAKLEMARNFWDEMGRGRPSAMHGPMLERLADYFELAPKPETVVAESLALGNTMIGLARHRRYAFHSAGALGVIEMTAPTRAGYVDQGLRRLKVPPKKRHYFALHAVLDVRHSEEWNREVIRPLVREDPRRARSIAEGALMRLWHGAQSFARYRAEFGLAPSAKRAA